MENNTKTSEAYINANGYFSESSGSYGQSFYGISNNNNWAIYYGNDNAVLTGMALCSTQSGQQGFNNMSFLYQEITVHDVLNNETGQTGAQYCYCNITGYKLQNLSSPWVYLDNLADETECADSCSKECARAMYENNFQWKPVYRSALLGSVAPGLATCEANVININWNDVDPEYAGQNNENTATYGEDVRTPVKAATKKGQTFRGWRFSAPEQTDLP